jgi:GNAT superfamily N-acetyltransferase
MVETSIQPVAPANLPRCLSTLTRAFDDDPVARWVFPDPAGYAAGFPAVVSAFAGIACPRETALQIGGFAGTAVWLPPGAEPDEDALGRAVALGVEEARLPAVFGLLERMAERHPTEPHWYLPFIGVTPAFQGRGYGSALLAETARTCDREGLPAYLEATSPANIALYRRHGFATLVPIRVDGSPPLTPMRREPGAAGT